VQSVIDPGAEAFWADPYGALAAARKQGRVARTPDGQPVLLAYADVDEALRHPALATFSLTAVLANAGVADGPLFDWLHRIMLGMNPPDHTRLRTLVNRAFTPRRVESLRQRTRAYAAELIDRHRTTGRMDWVADFAHELPIWAVCELVGVPTADRDQFKQWTLDVSLVFTNRLSRDDRRVAEDALISLSAYIAELVAHRRREPADDLLSALVHAEADGDRLSAAELEAMIANLLNGGHETTRSLLSIAVALLVAHPDALAALRADPGLVPGAVEEVLRYESPILSTMRVAVEPVEVGGVPLDPGQPVVLSFLAANRDPARFADPDRFDVRRADVRPVSFGFGIHHCVGAALARLEGQEALTELVTTCRDLELLVPAPVWTPFLQVRRIESLPIAFRTA
jgi:cytochrome P450